jgi:hypothetical protein
MTDYVQIWWHILIAVGIALLVATTSGQNLPEWVVTFYSATIIGAAVSQLLYARWTA